MDANRVGKDAQGRLPVGVASVEHEREVPVRRQRPGTPPLGTQSGTAPMEILNIE